MPGETPTHFRRQSRVLAVQILYELDVSGHSVDSSFSWLLDENDVPGASAEYALKLAKGVAEQLVEIDLLIHRYAPLWPVRQLPVVDRNILRLAMLEIRFTHGAPNKVVINEAVELAKTFGSESSPKFVNGVLGSMVDEMEGAPEVLPEPAMVAMDNLSQEGN